MKKLSLVLLFILCVGFSGICFAMGEVNTQDKSTVQDIAKDAETAVAQSYSTPEEVVELEDTMKDDAWSIEDPSQEADVFIGEHFLAVEANVTADSKTSREPIEQIKDFTKTNIVSEVKSVAETDESNKFDILSQLGILSEYGSLDNVIEKADFLLDKANEFYKEKQFQKVVDVCQYILQYLGGGQRGQEVNDLLNKALQKTR